MTNKKASQQNEELSHDYYWYFIVYLCPNYVAFNCNGGFMRELYLAYRDWDRGEFDIIGFHTREEMEEFCQFNPDYDGYLTNEMNLKEAKSIFERV